MKTVLFAVFGCTPVQVLSAYTNSQCVHNAISRENAYMHEQITEELVYALRTWLSVCNGAMIVKNV